MESSVDLTAKMSPDWWEVAKETVAEEPWPMGWPLVQSMCWCKVRNMIESSGWSIKFVITRERSLLYKELNMPVLDF